MAHPALPCFETPLGNDMYLSNGNAGSSCVPKSSHDGSQLVSPPIVLPHLGRLELSFDTLSYDEAGDCVLAGGFDGHDVGISTDGGETYDLLNNCTALADGNGTLIHHVFDISVHAGEIFAGIENFVDGRGTDIQIAVFDKISQRLKFQRNRVMRCA